MCVRERERESVPVEYVLCVGESVMRVGEAMTYLCWCVCVCV